MGGKRRPPKFPRGQKAKQAMATEEGTRKRVSRTPADDEVFEVQPGFIVTNPSTATGGVHYQRTKSKPKAINNGLGAQVEIHTTKTVDHEEAVKAIDALIKRVDYALRTRCTNTPFGWFIDEMGLRRLYEDIDDLKVEAEILNKAAKQAGSEREAHVNIVAAQLVLSTPHAAQEIGRVVRTTLTELYEALRSGHVKKMKDENGNEIRDALHAPLLRAKNLDKLTRGPAGDAVFIALERVATAKKEILTMLRQGIEPADAGAMVQLGAIENAITWFEDNVEWGYDPIDVALTA